ncbi:integral membrane protein MviN [Candidatus Omnitrophus magneticus]|uniref:Probable lipid II flippase MurJ n=1 Tax=Candidatus Omnitrophus magneticus TaxID=1609969 RepID=A0A0F0CJG6_9BACT|nr:integral membrane protein MviN [Candidatus Omnitrophus magneticus]
MNNIKSLIKSTGLLSVFILSSRIVGFFRDVVFARFFGTNIYAQAFVVAYKLPNMFRDMVGEGATDSAIVPVLSEYRHKKTEEEFWSTARIIFNVMLLTVLILTILGVIFAPSIVRVIVPGFSKDPEKFKIAVLLTRCVFPYIIFLGIVAYSKGVLNSINHFTMPAIAPVALNIVMMIFMIFLCPVIGIMAVVAGIIFGGFIQVALQMPILIKKGLKFDKTFRLIHPVSAKIVKLIIPRILGSALYQASILIDTVLASLSGIVGVGGVAALYYAHKLIHLPIALFAISLSTASLPRLSKEIALKDLDQFKHTIQFSLKIIFTAMAPATIGFMLLSKPIIIILFQRGEFNEYSTLITANSLFFYALGLFAYAGIKILVNAFYAMGDTKTPVKISSVSLILNFVLNLILMWPFKIGGLALATSLAAIYNFFMLYSQLARRAEGLASRELLLYCKKILISSLIMGISIVILKKIFLNTISSDIMSVLKVLIVIGIASTVYLIAGYFTGMEFTRDITVFFKKKINRVKN